MRESADNEAELTELSRERDVLKQAVTSASGRSRMRFGSWMGCSEGQKPSEDKLPHHTKNDAEPRKHTQGLGEGRGCFAVCKRGCSEKASKRDCGNCGNRERN